MNDEEDIIDYSELPEEEQLEFDDDDQGEYQEEDSVVEDVTPTDVPVEKTVTLMNKSGKGRVQKGRLGKLTGTRGEGKMVAYKTKDKLLSIINENMEDYKIVLDVLKREDPRAYVAAMTQLTKYIAPTLASVTAEVNAEARITIEDKLKDLSELK